MREWYSKGFHTNGSVSMGQGRREEVIREWHSAFLSPHYSKGYHNPVKANNLRYLRYGPVEALMSASVKLSGARPSYRIGVAVARAETQSRIDDNILETAKQRSPPNSSGGCRRSKLYRCRRKPRRRNLFRGGNHRGLIAKAGNAVRRRELYSETIVDGVSYEE